LCLYLCLWGLGCAVDLGDIEDRRCDQGADCPSNLCEDGFCVLDPAQNNTQRPNNDPNQNSDQGCPQDMVLVAAGAFTQGAQGYAEDEAPPRQVTLSRYCIDRTEVTVAQYAACVEGGGCQAPVEAYSDDEDCNMGAPQRQQHPINCVSMRQAAAYCQWAGRRLPTEAEWEKAARGTDGRTWPWGDSPSPSCQLAVMSEDGQSLGCGAGTTAPVGSKPDGASPYGALDMAGNVWEWTADGYEEDYYSHAPNTDPAGPDEDTYFVRRGGGWYYTAQDLRTTARLSDRDTFADDDLGFRCAR
jgi:formylglycine-generating enzyme required for sulfatase activity